MEPVVLVNPFRCRMWDLHDRLESEINEQTCRDEIDSVTKHGQLVCVLGRPLKDDPQYDVELIYGARRLFVARHLNRPLAVELREMSDREAIIAMDVENRLRLDLSPYEKGLRYLRWLRSNSFANQDDIARSLKVSGATVSRLIRIAGLPAVVVNAFGAATSIREKWGLALAEAWSDPDRRQIIAKRARAIAMRSPRPPAERVFKDIIALRSSRRSQRATHDQVVTDERGRPLFRVQRRINSTAIVLPDAITSEDTLQSLIAAVASILEKRHQGLEPRADILIDGSLRQSPVMGPWKHSDQQATG